MVEEVEAPVYRQPWFVRRLIYALLSLAGVIITGFGLMTDVQFNSLIEKLEPLLGLLMTMGLGMAAMKTNSTSDDVRSVPSEYDDYVHAVVQEMRNDLQETRRQTDEQGDLLSRLKSMVEKHE